MEQHFGIVFRSAHHFGWAAGSLTIFTILIVLAGLVTLLKRSSMSDMLYGVSGGHIFTSISAIVVTKGGMINGPVYSVDCIWFNALMAALYIGSELLLSAAARHMARTRAT